MPRALRTLAAAAILVAAVVTAPTAFTPSSSATAVAPLAEQHFVGILYANWFNQLCNNNAATCPPTYPQPIGGGYRYWGEPAGGKYLSDDVAVINRHADQLAAAGVDFIAIDYSNHNVNAPILDDPTRALLDTYRSRIAAGRPTPRVSFFVSRDQNDIRQVTDRWLHPYRDLWFTYQGKPLLTVAPSDCDPGWTVCGEYTHRGMWAFGQSPDTWTFMQHTPQTAATYAGQAEEVSVSVAQQSSYMSNTATAHGRRWNAAAGAENGYPGQNFDDQWNRALSLDPTFIMVRGWNEWAAIQLADPAVENGRYTDEYNEEYSNDIEPQNGGHGDQYYQSMRAHISRFKRSTRTGPIGAPGGKCVDVAGDDTGATGAPIQMWDCLGAADQQWTTGPDGTLRTLGKCMDVEGYGTANFSRIHLWDCHGGANQQWQPRPDGSLLNPASGRCLDDNAGNTTNGVRLQLHDCNGRWPQVFRLP
ncbi:ricin-type beta-trefoil lectin domain protein [Micromonosporaceae bacterium Da 78-11]